MPILFLPGYGKLLQASNHCPNPAPGFCGEIYISPVVFASFFLIVFNKRPIFETCPMLLSETTRLLLPIALFETEPATRKNTEGYQFIRMLDTFHVSLK
jgi:hypothetical protein